MTMTLSVVSERDVHGPTLASLTTLGVGGPADSLVTAQTEAEILEALRVARDRNQPVFPLGGGSNVVVADEGVKGMVLLIRTRGLHILDCGESVRVTAQAGEPWDEFTRLVTERQLRGVECLAGIPGQVGATPIQNVGAYGQEVAQTIESVRVVDRHSFVVSELSHAACEFSYRDSVFKRAAAERYVVLSVTYRLHKSEESIGLYGEVAQALASAGRKPTLELTRQTVIELRKNKSMVLDPSDPNGRSCGSFFVNAQVLPAELAVITERAGQAPPAFTQADGRFKVPSAWLIERAGLEKGTRMGAAGLSTRHTLSIVAHEGAIARDIVEFARHVRETVFQRFGVLLVPEPNFWGFSSLEAGLPAS